MSVSGPRYLILDILWVVLLYRFDISGPLSKYKLFDIDDINL